MNCPKCNHANAAEARFCAQCGQALPSGTSAVITATQSVGKQEGGQAAAVWFAQAAQVTVNVTNIAAAAFAASEQARRYLRMLAVIAAPVANGAGDGPPGGPPLDVWGEWERLRGAIEGGDPVTRAAAPWAVVRLAEPTAEGLRDALAPAIRSSTSVATAARTASGWRIAWVESAFCARLIWSLHCVAMARGESRRWSC